MRIIGVDPGSRTTGYGVIDYTGNTLVYVCHGHINAVVGDFTERPALIHTTLHSVVARWGPDEAAIEEAFVGNNPQSALKLGQARGAAIIALKSSDITIAGYSPRTVKQSVTGNGGADKDAVKKLVRVMLKIDTDLQSDAADGLAIALCHAYSRNARSNDIPFPQRRRKSKGRGLRTTL